MNHDTHWENENEITRKVTMEAATFYSSKGVSSFINSPPKRTKVRTEKSPTFSPLLIQSMATQIPLPSAIKTVGSRKGSSNGAAPVKLLTRVEQLKLLTKAEKAGLLSTAEKFGLSLSLIEKLGLLSKAEELGVLSAATDQGTPGALFSLSLGLLLLGPVCAYLVPEDYPWEIAAQVVVALVAVIGGSAAFAASNLVSDLQKLK